MYPAVKEAWLPFNKQLEGYLTWMYLDILGYVTTGMGNLIDPIETAYDLPWVRPDGTSATAEEIAEAWQAVDDQRSNPKGQRQMSGLATHYGQAFTGVTAIRLTEEGIEQVVARQVAKNEVILRQYFFHYDTMPADGQMCINSMAWAMGAGFPKTFTAFRAAVNNGDWLTAKANASFKGTGVQKRIQAGQQMCQNAADVLRLGLDPTVLHYPNSVPPLAPLTT